MIYGIAFTYFLEESSIFNRNALMCTLFEVCLVFKRKFLILLALNLGRAGEGLVG